MTLTMANNIVLRHTRLFSPKYPTIRQFTVSTDENIVDIDGEEEVKIDKICNKSRLRAHHRNLLFGQRPFSEPLTKAHTTIKYNRKLYGTFGSASGVKSGIMWPTKREISEQREYEKVAFPHTIFEMKNIANAEIQAKEREIEEVQNRVKANMAKLDMWKKQLKDTIAKREAEALAAKEKKDKLMEEVRRHFGFTVDPRDERFKEMLALKEKEMKKKEKQAKYAEKEKKAIARLMEKHNSDLEAQG